LGLTALDLVEQANRGARPDRVAVRAVALNSAHWNAVVQRPQRCQQDRDRGVHGCHCPRVALAEDRAERAEAENAQLTEALDRVQKTPDRLVRLSHWINQGNEGRDPEAILWGRVSKVSEECGEAIEALIGWTGQNPRKGVTHGRGDLVEELLDVAVTALGAIEHVCDHQGDSLDLLDEKVRRVVERAGLDGADS
jgi:hypothetical protein